MAELAPVPALRFFDSNGDPLNGGFIYTYEAGTTTEKATYKDFEATEANTNPVVLDSDGYSPYDVRLLTGYYKFVIKDSAGVTIRTIDNIQSHAQLITTEGALAVNNNLSDLQSVSTALTNLGIAPFSTPKTTAITDSMSATSISGYDFTPGNWVHVVFFVTRDSGSVLGAGSLDLLYNGSSWDIVEGNFVTPSGGPYIHGLTFSMSTNQLQVADSNASGAGSLITKYHSVL